MDDKELESIAMKEILIEAERGKQRASEMGANGWNKPQTISINKRFLSRTIVSTVHSHLAVAGRRQRVVASTGSRAPVVRRPHLNNGVVHSPNDQSTDGHFDSNKRKADEDTALESQSSRTSGDMTGGSIPSHSKSKKSDKCGSRSYCETRHKSDSGDTVDTYDVYDYIKLNEQATVNKVYSKTNDNSTTRSSDSSRAKNE